MKQEPCQKMTETQQKIEVLRLSIPRKGLRGACARATGLWAGLHEVFVVLREVAQSTDRALRVRLSRERTTKEQAIHSLVSCLWSNRWHTIHMTH